MASDRRRLPIHTPPGQHWACHRRGDCCREHIVFVTGEEVERIARQGWDKDPALRNQGPFRQIRVGGRRVYALNQRADGTCVFLDDEGLCRIHRRYGERAKPLACQLFPFIPVRLGPQVRWSVRFSCPSAAYNLGPDVQQHLGQLKRLFRQVAEPTDTQLPLVVGNVRAAHWDAVLAYLDTAARFFQHPAVDFRLQLLRLAAWHGRALEVLGRVTRWADEYDRLAAEAIRHVGQESLTQPAPSRMASLVLRVTAARIARRDTLADRSWTRGVVRAARVLRLVIAPRKLPPLGPFAPVDADQLASVSPEADEAARETLFRYARVKLWSGQFFGDACFGLPLHDGLVNWLFLMSLVLWLARWHACGRRKSEIDLEAAVTALGAVDHHFGFDPFLANWAHRFRVKYLWDRGELVRLIAHGGTAATAPRKHSPEEAVVE